jgi:hypothetical protein
MTTIQINILEVASELAHEIVCAKFEDDSAEIYNDVSDDVSNYTEKAQDVFNEWYDYYYYFLKRLEL